MRKAGLNIFVVMVVAVLFLSIGCHGFDYGHHDEGANNSSVSEYRNTVYEMKNDLQGYLDVAGSPEGPGEYSSSDYYARMTDHLGRLGALRDRMDGDDYAGGGSRMMDAMVQMMDFERDCLVQLDHFMELCQNEGVEHEEHPDHVSDHAGRMDDLLDEMSDYCDEMLDMMDDDHGHEGGGHMGG